MILRKLKIRHTPRHNLFYEFHSNESKDPKCLCSFIRWDIGVLRLVFMMCFGIPLSSSLQVNCWGTKAVRFWHDQLFYKPAHHGGVVAWHQDYSYWRRTLPMQHLTCWVALDDVTTENGCLYYVPKSHTWGLLDKPELAGDMEGLQQF
jgi:hypothetical protein